MKLLDIWINLQHEINFFNKRNFEDIPRVPGVYAWFYPLQICSFVQEEFFNDIANVFDYDANDENGIPQIEIEETLSWRKVLMRVLIQNKNPNYEQFRLEWENACRNEESFKSLRNTFYKSTILMPPLYVGKTDNLYRRCHEHLYSRTNSNSFSSRFCEQASKKNFQAATTVSDLLLICIQTRHGQDFKGDFEGMIEMFLKNLTKPVYSMK